MRTATLAIFLAPKIKDFFSLASEHIIKYNSPKCAVTYPLSSASSSVHYLILNLPDFDIQIGSNPVYFITIKSGFI
jgi:hypothetical protein